MLGGEFSYSRLLGAHTATFGLQTRLDLADVALRRAAARDILATVRGDAVTQWGSGSYIEVRSGWTPRLRTVLGLRGDAYRFGVTSDRPENSGNASDAILSPKESMAYQATDALEIYLSGGFGFHSNDPRGIVQTIDPVTSRRSTRSGARAAPKSGYVPRRWKACAPR